MSECRDIYECFHCNKIIWYGNNITLIHMARMPSIRTTNMTIFPNKENIMFFHPDCWLSIAGKEYSFEK